MAAADPSGAGSNTSITTRGPSRVAWNVACGAMITSACVAPDWIDTTLRGAAGGADSAIESAKLTMSRLPSRVTR
jgi:hypothetical protein